MERVDLICRWVAKISVSSPLQLFIGFRGIVTLDLKPCLTDYQLTVIGRSQFSLIIRKFHIQPLAHTLLTLNPFFFSCLLVTEIFPDRVNRTLAKINRTGSSAHPTIKNNSCGMGILPVPSIDEKDFCKRSNILFGNFNWGVF